jgi:hypothetical protein
VRRQRRHCRTRLGIPARGPHDERIVFVVEAEAVGRDSQNRTVKTRAERVKTALR